MITVQRRVDRDCDMYQLVDLIKYELMECLREPGSFELIVRRDELGNVTFHTTTHS